MVLRILALKRGGIVAGHQIQNCKMQKCCASVCHKRSLRQYVTKADTRGQLRNNLAKEHVKELSEKQRAKKEARAIDKDFFVSVLGSTATKREAKSYIQRFTPSKSSVTTTSSVAQRRTTSPKSGVNLGVFYAPAAVEESPRFVRHSQIASQSLVESQVHVALVKIRAPQCLEEETLNGVGRTLSQLGRLGLGSVVVVDCDTYSDNDDTVVIAPPTWRSLAKREASRVAAAIDSNCDTGARLVEDVIGVPDNFEQSRSSVLARTSAHVTLRQLLTTPLRRGLIPVIPCIAHTDTSQVSVPITGADAVLALSRELAGIASDANNGADPAKNEDTLKAQRDEVSLDRLIILDPLGGIPSSTRPIGYHVFLNMEQEFEPAQQDLLQALKAYESSTSLQNHDAESIVSDLGSSNPFSAFVGKEFSGKTSTSSISTPSRNELVMSTITRSGVHLKNLELVRSVLSILPPSSSAILTTPEEAANSAKISSLQPGGVGTRRYRNPLIHNLLTDKPVYSSSLPSGRLGYAENATADTTLLSTTSVIPTTFAKHGMPVVIFPDPADIPWKATAPGNSSLKLTDPQIDLSRLIHLIDDSFDRKLDVEDYLKRVNDRIAGVIIAGDYEGAAILTWETPHGVMDDGSPESRARMVPYLDKFAVLKRAQGSGGVADIVFTAMVRDCFPSGVVWRSRTTNVVNKWYFERSRGTWKLPNTGWTMFWTTPVMSRQTFLDCEGVCRGIVPSWADKKAVLD